MKKQDEVRTVAVYLGNARTFDCGKLGDIPLTRGEEVHGTIAEYLLGKHPKAFRRVVKVFGDHVIQKS